MIQKIIMKGKRKNLKACKLAFFLVQTGTSAFYIENIPQYVSASKDDVWHQKAFVC